jgi:hypothetical protein
MLEDHYTTPWFDVSIMHTNTRIELRLMSGLDFSRYCSPPTATLVVHYAVMVQGLLVSDDNIVLK